MAPLLGLATLYGNFVRKFFAVVGLSSQTLAIDEHTTIHLWGPKSGDQNNKPNLLLIHAFGPSAIWTGQYQIRILNRYFNLYLPDLVFFGESTSSSTARSEAFQAESIGKVMEMIGIKKFHVVRTSYGGFVAYSLAKMWPERVEKVVIASCGLNLRKSDNDELIKRARCRKVEEVMLPATAEELRTLTGLSLSSRALRFVPAIFYNDFVHEMYYGNRKEKKELLDGLSVGRDENPSITPLKQEVLLIWGDEDKIFPSIMAVELKEILGVKTRLELIKNAWHMPQAENSREFNKILEKFLRDSS